MQRVRHGIWIRGDGLVDSIDLRVPCGGAPQRLGWAATFKEQNMAMDVVDFEIRGSEMQFVEVELDPGEAAIGEAGSMMFMDAGITMDTVFGDASSTSTGSGLFGKLLSAGKRLVTGESLFTTVYTNQAQGKQRVAFAAPYPGKILPMDLRQLGGTLLCQKDAFLCAARGVQLGIAFQQKMSVGFFGGEGFIMQKLDGNGMAFVHAGGTVVKRELQPGQVLLVDTGCVVAYTPNVSFEIQYVGKVKTALFGGEGLFFAKLSGPGTIWLQSLPFSRLASRVFAAAPQRGGSREEGSVLGAVAGGGLLGGLLGGGDDE
jgi:uncharacterized protein (TIGR00266 family)